MRLPRDMSGEDLAALLRRRYGYQLVRQRGSHMTLTRTDGDESHSVTRSAASGSAGGHVGRDCGGRGRTPGGDAGRGATARVGWDARKTGRIFQGGRGCDRGRPGSGDSGGQGRARARVPGCAMGHRGRTMRKTGGSETPPLRKEPDAEPGGRLAGSGDVGVGARASAGPRLRAAWATGDERGGLRGRRAGLRRRPYARRGCGPEGGCLGVAKWG